MAEIGEHGSAFFQTPANTNEIMRAASVGVSHKALPAIVSLLVRISSAFPSPLVPFGTKGASALYPGAVLLPRVLSSFDFPAVLVSFLVNKFYNFASSGAHGRPGTGEVGVLGAISCLNF